MLSVPLPIVVALMLVMVIAINREALLNLPRGRWFLALLVLYCVVLVLIGIRWTIGVTAVMPLLPMLAVAWCILTWIAFRSLTRTGASISWQDWPHALPMLIVVAAMFAPPLVLEVVIVLCNVGYGVLLIKLARKGEDALRMVKFNAARNCLRAIWISAAMLIYFGVVEVIIALDFELTYGSNAAMIVTLANIPSLFLLGLVATGAGLAGSREESDPEPTPIREADPEKLTTPTGVVQTDTEPAANKVAESKVAESNPDNREPVPEATEHSALLAQLSELLIGQKLYADTELNLQRLARKAGVPARQVSRAVNSETGLNVSQWVNKARVQAACDQLKQTDATVLEIMTQVGFATKSNFNREFRRIAGMSPSDWRKQSG
jgi:AraC-like DNA-binding protein